MAPDQIRAIPYPSNLNPTHEFTTVWRLALNAVAARMEQEAAEVAGESDYELGFRDGFHDAVQLIDTKTGGDGEYFYSTVPGEGCATPADMIAKIEQRFADLKANQPLPFPKQFAADVTAIYDRKEKRELERTGSMSIVSLAAIEFSEWLLQRPRQPSEMANLYHAYEQGVYAGLVGYNHKRDCNYTTPNYRLWWMHGCIAGEDKRRCQAAIADCERRIAELERTMRLKGPT